MNTVKSLRFTCIRCGKCCTDKNTIVNLTYLDILRIKNVLKLNIDEMIDILGFYTFDKPLSSEQKKRMAISPIETERGFAFIGLLKNSLGGCYFYDSNDEKCLIYNLRPMFCKTFPFSFGILKKVNNEVNTEIDIFYTEKGKKFCKGIGKDAPFIDKDHWINLGTIALQELEKNHNVIKEWNNSVRIGNIIPTVKKFILTIFKLENL